MRCWITCIGAGIIHAMCMGLPHWLDAAIVGFIIAIAFLCGEWSGKAAVFETMSIEAIAEKLSKRPGLTVTYTPKK